MNALTERNLKSLHGSEMVVDLREHMYELISVHIGYTALILAHNTSGGNVFFALQSKESLVEITGGITEAEPGSRIKIGKTKGVEIATDRSSTFADLAIMEAIQNDRHISRRHAQIDVISPFELSITDLSSTNGTYVKDVVESPEYRRSRLHIVK